MIDLEDSTQTDLSKGRLGAIAKSFCDEIRAAGYTPVLYCNENWYKNYIDVSQVADVEKWIARYSYKYSDSIPRGVWQSCSTGRVDGVKWNCDIDFGYKDYTQIVTPRTEPQAGYHKTVGYWMKDSHGWWLAYYTGGYPTNKWEKISGIGLIKIDIWQLVGKN
ncbi:GH25 family lysozyme [Agathobacter sp.]|uniref:GH25 family lysozyme n=1 Tax=Agathobacter sp. TaxID=2021311 RepID=UPI003FD8F65F